MENEVQQFNKDFTRSIQKLSKESPGMVKGFNAFHDQIMKGGVLSGKEKEFIALGIAIAVHCVSPHTFAHTSSNCSWSK